MKYTLRDLQQSAPFNEIQVIAGLGGIDRPIRFAGVLDAPDSIRFVREGEFVMTSGYIITNSNETLISIIEELHNRKAAALGIKMFRYVQSISDEARQLADKYDLPLLFIPNKFSWHDLIFPLMLNVSAADDDNSPFLHIYDQLVNSLRQSQTILDALNRSGELLQHPLTLVNEETLFTLNYPAEFNLPVQLDAEFLQRILSSGSTQLQDGKVRYYRNSGSDNIQLLMVNLGMKEYQYLILWDSPSPHNPTAFNSLVYCLILIRDSIYNQRNKQKNLIHKKNTLLNELFRPGENSQKVRRREAGDLQMDTDLRYSPAICYLSTGKKLSIFETALARCFEQLNQKYSIHSCIDEDNVLHFLLPINDLWKSRHDIVKYTRTYGWKIRKYLQEAYPDKTLQLLIGPVADTWEQIPARHLETRNAMKLLRSDEQKEPVVHIHDMGATCLLATPIIAASLPDFYEEYFSPLHELETEVQKNMLETLNAYIRTGFNFRETARVLDVHHNTVRNRLEQFSTLTGLTITQHQDLLIILICLHSRQNG